MVNVNRREILTYNEGECYYYQLSDSLHPTSGISFSEYPGLKVSIPRVSQDHWMRFCEEHIDFCVIAGGDISDFAFAELSYLILTGVETGYKVSEINVAYDSIHLVCEHPALSTISTEIGECPEDECSLPITFSMHYSKPTTPESDDCLMLDVKTPRVKNGKQKWRKFQIVCAKDNHVYEYHKKYYREIRFLQPTSEEKENRQQPVEVIEHYL